VNARRFLVSGKVQGVFFRASTRQQAEQLGLTGHAVNLSDGRVEVVAHGCGAALDRLAEWLRHGPDAARVEHVEVEAVARTAPKQFKIG